MEAAPAVREELGRHGLTRFVMTTGSTGLHVTVPLLLRKELKESELGPRSDGVGNIIRRPSQRASPWQYIKRYRRALPNT